jgi:DNA-binding LacI/PurR family transcriptional regulator/DNA-binding transcriptional regulator YhcF (GntR family)
MEISPGRTPKILSLASELESDIRAKGLGPGDSYLSTHDAARMLGVSTVAANRALQLLVKREVLFRRQRSGTFIAQPRSSTKAAFLDRVHMLVHRNFLRSEGLLADGVILGIQETLPQADIQFNFLPSNNEGSYVNSIVAEILGSARTEGFVLVRTPLEVQRIVQASGLPAVIHGTPFPSINSVAWIDRDHYQAGRLAASNLIQQGLKCLTVITREKLMPGDFRLLDAVRDEMSAAQLPVGNLTWRALPSDTETVRHTVLELLDAVRGSHGFICRSHALAEGAVEAIASKELRLGMDANVLVLDVYQASEGRTRQLPYIKSLMTPEAMGQRIGQMLLQQAQGTSPSPNHEIVPVEFIKPRE